MKSRKLHIAMITNNYTPYCGGVVRSLQTLIHQLQVLDHRITLITYDFTTDTNDDSSYVIRVPSIARFFYKKNHIVIPWNTYKIVSSTLKADPPDIVHIHHPFFLCSTAIQVAQKLNLPVIFTYHTLYERYMHYIPLPERIKQFILTKSMQKLYNAVDGIIAPSSYVAARVREDHPTMQLYQIPSGINRSFFSSTPQKKIKRKRFELLHVGRFAAEKNIPFLLNMFATLNQNPYRLTLIGYGYELDNLRKHAYKTLNLSPRCVRFLPKQNPEDLKRSYQEADLFLFSSQTDTQGLVLAESMSQGTPVVALQGPGQADIIRNGYNGYLVDTMEQMRTHIEYIHRNPTLQQKLSDGAHKTAHTYHPQKIAQRIIAAYHDLIEGY